MTQQDSRPPKGITRRRFLGAAGAAGLILVSGSPVWSAPKRGSAPGRPRITHGVQSGDVSVRSGVVWARADRPARMIVEVSPTESFRRVRRYRGPVATPQTDLTARLELRGLPPGEEVFYRIRFEDEERPGRVGEAVSGSFRTAPVRGHGASFVWGGDTAGQGWGINPEFGGMRIYETMLREEPDFFIHSGDNIYADNPLEERVALPDGTVWRNVLTEEKAKVAETLDEFRGNYKYNLLDENLLRFNAAVPTFAQWDDHEVTNNWYPGEVLEDPRYTVKDVDVLAARARRAFREYLPLRRRGEIYRKVSYGSSLEIFFLDLRTYRGPNTANDQPVRSELTELFGERQLRWIKRELRRSRATWKVIASDLPVGLVVPDGAAFEAIANARPGAPLGRELELAELLSFIKREKIRNTVWLTADVHYTAAHYYDPSQAAFRDFDPFWEFVSGPLHAGTFGPNQLDPTFGPQVVFQRAADYPNQPPSDGLQFYGHAAIDGETKIMTVSLKDLRGETLYSVELEPAR